MAKDRFQLIFVMVPSSIAGAIALALGGSDGVVILAASALISCYALSLIDGGYSAIKVMLSAAIFALPWALFGIGGALSFLLAVLIFIPPLFMWIHLWKDTPAREPHSKLAWYLALTSLVVGAAGLLLLARDEGAEALAGAPLLIGAPAIATFIRPPKRIVYWTAGLLYLSFVVITGWSFGYFLLPAALLLLHAAIATNKDLPTAREIPTGIRAPVS